MRTSAVTYITANNAMSKENRSGEAFHFISTRHPNFPCTILVKIKSTKIYISRGCTAFANDRQLEQKQAALMISTEKWSTYRGNHLRTMETENKAPAQKTDSGIWAVRRINSLLVITVDHGDTDSSEQDSWEERIGQRRQDCAKNVMIWTGKTA